MKHQGPQEWISAQPGAFTATSAPPASLSSSGTAWSGFLSLWGMVTPVVELSSGWHEGSPSTLVPEELLQLHTEGL